MATALDLYEPFDAGAGANITEDQWRSMARHWLGSGVLRGEDNLLAVFADSSGMQVKVPTGKVFVRSHYGENQSEKTLPITANASGSTRIDLVVARADFVNNRIELDVVAGTPAAGAAPAPTQSSAMWELPLAEVSVPNADASIDAGQITDRRAWAVPTNGAGGTIGTAKQTAAASRTTAVALLVPGLTKTIVPASALRNIRVRATVHIKSTVAGDIATLRIAVDGVNKRLAQFSLDNTTQPFTITAVFDGTILARLSAAPHLITVTFERGSGTGTVTATIDFADETGHLEIEDIGAS